MFGRWGAAWCVSVIAHLGAATGGLAWRVAQVRALPAADELEVIGVTLVEPTPVAAERTPGEAAKEPEAAAAAASRPAPARAHRRPRQARVSVAVPARAPVRGVPVMPDPLEAPSPPAGDPQPAAPPLLAAAASISFISSGPGGRGVGQGAADRARVISPEEARYYRIYETFPRLPEELRSRGSRYRVRVNICIAASGDVQAVEITQGGPPALERALAQAIRTWRYRPRLVEGVPTPFCHPLAVQYLAE